MCGGGGGATLTLLGTEMEPDVVCGADRAGDGHEDWPMDANGSLLVAGLEK